MPIELVTYPAPDSDPDRPVLFDDEIAIICAGVTARVTVCRSVEPLSAGFPRATRRGGLTICSGRPAHETTLAGQESRPGARHIFGEARTHPEHDCQSPQPSVTMKQSWRS
jgi:hypothetical protein